MRLISIFCLLLVLIATACSDRKEDTEQRTLFRLLSPGQTKVDFVNRLEYTESFNTYTFKNFYNGGGVGVGDFNNDSLPDLFLTGNLVSNRLYLNKGNLSFEDITGSAGLTSSGTWSTGVSVVDINHDGWLDLYVCHSGQPGGERRHNELFINRGDLTFSEESKAYGLDLVGLSTHAGFFDYDGDGDLDCYLLNNSIRSIGAYDLRKDQRMIPDPLGGNKLLRNDDGRFVDVSEAAGIYTSMIGFGLGVTIGDVDKDGWPDIYVSNDFFEKDYLYLNQKDGTFREALESMIREISLGSMGADMADINNDALPEIFVTEMLPESDDRLKTTTQFENWDKYQANVQQGYYHQFSRNVLQLNNGDGTFSEVGRLAGVHATDWSWGALIFDMNNDGRKDIFVANGIYKDLLDQDYVNFVSNSNRIREILSREGKVIKQLIDSIPTNKIANFAFENQKHIMFRNQAGAWGLDQPTHSNGSAYADLDNDGDLDLILNNVNMPAHVYENLANDQLPANGFLAITLHGEGKNPYAVGSKVTVFANGEKYYQEHFPSRGFMSSVDYKLTFGLGTTRVVDSVLVQWPDMRVTLLRNVAPRQHLHLDQKDGEMVTKAEHSADAPIFKRARALGADFAHRENPFVDFDRDRLLFNMISAEGPCLCTGDVNNDRLTDFYVGGAKNQPGGLFVQNASGDFKRIASDTFAADSTSEDTDCVFFDANGDGKLDLYVTSGGIEFSPSSPALIDRLYFNKGAGRFEKGKQILPLSTRFESTSAVRAVDFDQDGDKDLFVGVRVIPGLYGVPGNGYLLRNDGSGNFANATDEIAPGLLNLGMITDAAWLDINGDKMIDLVVVGDWMGVRMFVNDGGRLNEADAGFMYSDGWYQTVEAADLDGDGWLDIVTGNHGLNSRFKASRQEPLHLYINDFDQNGSVEHVLTRFYDGKSLPLVLRQDLVMQIPALKKKYLHYENFKGQEFTDIFTADQRKNTVVLTAYDLESAAWLNNKDGTFRKIALPLEAQFSPVNAIHIEDINGDGLPDILLGGNLHRAKPETGIYDGSYGLLLKGAGDGSFTVIPASRSGICIRGEIRGIKKISDQPGRVIIARNNDKLEFLRY